MESDLKEVQEEEKEIRRRLKGLEKRATDGENQADKMRERFAGVEKTLNTIRQSPEGLGQKQGKLLSRADKIQVGVSKAIDLVLELQEENQGMRDALSDARSQLWRV